MDEPEQASPPLYGPIGLRLCELADWPQAVGHGAKSLLQTQLTGGGGIADVVNETSLPYPVSAPFVA